jgi:hypothetical protein
MSEDEAITRGSEDEDELAFVPVPLGVNWCVGRGSSSEIGKFAMRLLRPLFGLPRSSAEVDCERGEGATREAEELRDLEPIRCEVDTGGVRGKRDAVAAYVLQVSTCRLRWK